MTPKLKNKFLQKIKERVTFTKNNNTWLLLLWNEMIRKKGKKELRKYSDLESVNRLYYSHANRYPDLKAPTLFSEKLQWLKLYYRDDIMEQCADKYEVRKYVEEKGYADTLNELLGIYDKVEDINIEKLPNRFVLKGAHGSAWNIICKDKSKVNWTAWHLIMKSWLKHNIFWNGREWIYKDAKPRMVCEKYLEDVCGNLIDYKFFCFNGEPKFVQVNMGRGKKQQIQNFYNLQWKLLPFGKDINPSFDVDIQEPQNFKYMIDIAKDLSSPFSFVRTDLYNINGKVVFGELTFFPASGMPDFIPSEYDSIVGKMLELPKKNNRITNENFCHINST
ncbi:MAG: hypothetical protein GY777_06095 [Candidatus Brocadiaceae bacterium]|nr:hypothetical protein [Candidatus Brocadiaceae bacterium]